MADIGMGHGGRRPGAGAPLASERDPARLCGRPTGPNHDGPPCKRYMANETSVCPVHGSGTPQARDKAIVARTTEALGLPAVPVRDYPQMVGEHIAVLSDEADRITAELDRRRLVDMTEIDVHREFGDVLAQRDAKLGVIAKLAGSVARLSQAKAANTAADAGAEFLRSQSFGAVLAAVNDALADYPEARAALAERLLALVDGAA